jgi:hypothetical protein
MIWTASRKSPEETNGEKSNVKISEFVDDEKECEEYIQCQNKQNFEEVCINDQKCEQTIRSSVNRVLFTVGIFNNFFE